MKIIKILESGISKEVFNNQEKEYHIPVIIDEQEEKECCYVSVYYDNEHEADNPSFLLFSDMRSEDLDYPFQNEQMKSYIDMINRYESQ